MGNIVCDTCQDTSSCDHEVNFRIVQCPRLYNRTGCSKHEARASKSGDKLCHRATQIGSGQRQKLPTPQEYVTSLHSCTTKFLSPLYDSCSNLLDELAHNETHDGVIGRELFLCFTRVVDRHQVGTCALDA